MPLIKWLLISKWNNEMDTQIMPCARDYLLMNSLECLWYEDSHKIVLHARKQLLQVRKDEGRTFDKWHTITCTRALREIQSLFRQVIFLMIDATIILIYDFPQLFSQYITTNLSIYIRSARVHITCIHASSICAYLYIRVYYINFGLAQRGAIFSHVCSPRYFFFLTRTIVLFRIVISRAVITALIYHGRWFWWTLSILGQSKLTCVARHICTYRH